MITISANGNKPAYGIKEYTLDTAADLEKLSVRSATTGSKAFVIETSKYYMLNSKKEWVEIKPYGNSIFDGDEDTEIDYDGGDLDDTPSDSTNSNEKEESSNNSEDDEIVFEGGDM